MIYAGIGSRKTPREWLSVMERIAKTFAARGWTLRSGAAPGADSAFEYGAAGGRMETFLPWAGFQGRSSGIVLDGQVRDRAILLASVIHPNWAACSPASRLLHARDIPQIWGANLDMPVDLVICWAPPTKDGSVEGGTRTAVEAARAAGVPVFNLAVPGTLERLRSLYGRSTSA